MTYILLTLTTISFIILFYLSHQNGEDTHETSLNLTNHLSFLSSDTETLHSNLRRYAHIFLFAVFTFLFTLTLHNFHYPYYFLAFPLLYTWADEATKVFIPGRHFSWFDVGLNLIGVVIGGVLGLYTPHRKPHLHGKITAPCRSNNRTSPHLDRTQK